MRRMLLVGLAAVLLSSCGAGGDGGRFAFFMTLVGLPDSDTVRGHYEGWAVVNGNAQSTGKFVVVGTGPTAQVMPLARNESYGSVQSAEFGPASTQLGDDFPFITAATHLFVTLEPEGDHDGAPSCQVLLAGAIVNGQAALTPGGFMVTDADPFPCGVPAGGGMLSVGFGDFSTATGQYAFGSPTDDVSNPVANDEAGVWFGDAGMALLDLPALSGGYRYEGFVVIDGETRSMGKFLSPNGADDDAATAPQRGPDSPGPAFPGQDFVQPFTPTLVSDPPVLDLVATDNFMDGDFRCVVTVEPDPDNDTAPFLQLTLLDVIIPEDAVTTTGLSSGDIELDSQFFNLPTASAATAVGSITLTGITLAPLDGGTDRRGHYQLWLEIDGMIVPHERFLIDGSDVFSLDSNMNIGTTASTTFMGATIGAPSFPTTCFITVEPQGDDDMTPSPMEILAGDVSTGTGILSVEGGGTGRGIADFSLVEGTFHLRSRTDDDVDLFNDSAGIVFRNRLGPDLFATSLILPDLPPGWTYEGWVQDRASTVHYSTGRFTDPSAPDHDVMTSQSRGDLSPFGFPGRDFVNDVPTVALAAAVPGSITEVFVTIEAHPDNALAPGLMLLHANVPAGAVIGGVGQGPQPMTNVFDVSLSGSMTIDQ